jgi:hypothetical protein
MIRHPIPLSRLALGLGAFILTCTALLYALVLVAHPANAQDNQRFVPLFTNFTYWNHHWLQWLPTHPRFEAIEAAIAEVGERRLIRVWLTERTPPKRQFYFFNDAGAAAAQGADSYSRPIRFAYEAQEGKPADLDLAFEDDEGRAIIWSLRFAESDLLSDAYSGLKPPGGHGEAGRFLLFWTGPNTVTMQSETRIGGEIFGIAPADLAARKHYYGAAYSQGAWNGTFPYARAEIAFGYRTAPFGFAEAGRLETVQTVNGVSLLRHSFGSHDMSVRFDPPLPRQPTAGFGTTFTVSFDNETMPALSGQVITDGAGYLWRPSESKWALGSAIRSAMRTAPSGYILEVSR